MYIDTSIGQKDNKNEKNNTSFHELGQRVLFLKFLLDNV